MLIYFVLRSLIRTIDLSVEGTSVRNSKINASIILLFAHLFVPLTYRSKVLSLGSKNKYEFILYFSHLFVPLSASSGVHG